MPDFSLYKPKVIDNFESVDMKIVIKNDAKKKNRITATVGGKAAGYIDYKHPDDLGGKRNLEIKFIRVYPAFRRQKIATRLLEFFVKKFSKKVVWLSFWSSRYIEEEKAYGVYLKLGFKRAVYMADYYADGIGVSYFTKRLDLETEFSSGNPVS
ncbi:MAG: GNAT family N-acetyltransferase [bacterium]|nr:GNAT family N-acetyltransferase [bacterium]